MAAPEVARRTPGAAGRSFLPTASCRTGAMVQRALDFAMEAQIIAADGGARNALALGLPVHIVIGDSDSLSEPEVQSLAATGTYIKTFPAEKDYTDLELALMYACEMDINWVRIIGALGGRIDQTLSNVYLLSLPALDDRDVRIVDGEQELRLLLPGRALVGRRTE